MKNEGQKTGSFSKKHIISALGVFIGLLGVLFLLAPRTHLQPLCYVIEFPFGIVGQYILCLGLVYLAIRIAFREHFYKFSFRILIGFLIAFFGCLIIGSLLRISLLDSFNRDFVTEFRDYAYEGKNGGLLGDVSLGGGIVGYKLVKSMISVHIVLPGLIGGFAIAIGLIIATFPALVALFRKIKSVHAINKSRRERLAKEERDRTENIIFTDFDDEVEDEPIPLTFEPRVEEEIIIDDPEEDFVSSAPTINFNENVDEIETINQQNFSFKTAKNLDMPTRKELREAEEKATKSFVEISQNSVEVENPNIVYDPYPGEEGLHLAFFNPAGSAQPVKKEPKSTLTIPVFNGVATSPVEQKEEVIHESEIIQAPFVTQETKIQETETYDFGMATSKEEPNIIEAEVNEVTPQSFFEETSIDESFVAPEENIPPVKEVKIEQEPEISFTKPGPEIKEEIQEEKPAFEEKPSKTPVDPVSGVRYAKSRKKYVMPSLSLLDDGKGDVNLEEQVAECEANSQLINQAFTDLGIKAYVDSYTIGPSVTRYNIATERQSSVTSINKVLTDISVRLSGASLRFSEIVPGMTTSGLEIKNSSRRTVTLKELLSAMPHGPKDNTLIPFGLDISGKVIYSDLREFPHLLVAGTTGSGKSIFMHGLLLSLIMKNRPEDLKLLLIDPKKVEMSRYKDIPHLLCPIVKDAGEACVALEKLTEEMERRYEIFEKCGYSTLAEYNEYYAPEAKTEKLPLIICVIDEFADLIEQNKNVNSSVLRIASKARSAGIHLIVATQRPDAKVISGTIKANLGVRVALTVASQIDSQTIIGRAGAEELCGKGDMLIDCINISKQLIRAQGCFVNRPESNNVTNFITEQMEQDFDPNFLDLTDHSAESNELEIDYNATGPSRAEMKANSDEDLYREICRTVINEDYMSISKIQRLFPIGFNRAGKFFARLQEDGIISKTNDSQFSNKGHKVLIHSEEELFSEEMMSSTKPSF